MFVYLRAFFKDYQHLNITIVWYILFAHTHRARTMRRITFTYMQRNNNIQWNTSHIQMPFAYLLNIFSTNKRRQMQLFRIA